jgi:hypothetical protein
LKRECADKEWNFTAERAEDAKICISEKMIPSPKMEDGVGVGGQTSLERSSKTDKRSAELFAFLRILCYIFQGHLTPVEMNLYLPLSVMLCALRSAIFKEGERHVSAG